MTETTETPKRPRGSGSIYLVGPYWHYKFYSRFGAHRESSRSTDRKVAEKLLRRKLAEVTTKTYAPCTNVRVDELIEDMLSEYRQRGRKSIESAEARWEKHLKPFFTKLRADDLNTDLVRRYCDKRKLEGASNASVNRELAILKHSFKLALKTTPPKVQRVPIMPSYKEGAPCKDFLEDSQYGPLARECTKVGGLWLRTLLATGCAFGFRSGEMLQMRVKQIDLSNQTIRLEAGTTKNGEGRMVKLTQETLPLLTACCIGKKPDDFVFTRPDKKRKDGTPVKGKPVEGFRKAWATVCCSVGAGRLVCPDCYAEAKAESRESLQQMVPPPPADENGKCPDCGRTWKRSQLKYYGLKVHGLRRTFARNARRLGVTEGVAMRMGGWKTRSVFDRYNIIDEADLADAARRFDAKQNAAAPDFGQSLGSVAENCTKNGAPSELNFDATVLPN